MDMQISDGFHFGPRPYHKTRGTANSGFREFKFKDNGKERVIERPVKNYFIHPSRNNYLSIRTIGEERLWQPGKKAGDDGISNGRIVIKRNFL
jgi:hypothetical protein